MSKELHKSIIYQLMNKIANHLNNISVQFIPYVMNLFAEIFVKSAVSVPKLSAQKSHK